MKLSRLIKEAQALLADEGDLDVLDAEFRAVDAIYVEESDGEFDPSWQMPAGFKYAQLN